MVDLMAQRTTVLPTARSTVHAPHPMGPLIPSSAPPAQRLLSLDALRGFTMFWIVGGREVFLGVAACLDAGLARWFGLSPELAKAMGPQLDHNWGTFAAWDLIMPMFLFVVGAAMPFAMEKRSENGRSLGQTLWRIGRRVAVLWVCGMVVHGRLLYFSWRNMDLQFFSDTLQAIAVGYLVCSLALLFLSLRGQIILLVGLVLGYWALLMFVPFGGHPAGTLEKSANLARYVDEWVMGSHRRDHLFAWIVPSLGFTATVLLGTMAGRLLRGRLPPGRKIALMTAIGSGLMAAGWLWSYSLPLNRFLWTSSMILWAGGWSFLALALFYGTIDIGDYKRWAFPFVVIGANALFAYVIDMVYANSLSDAWFSNVIAQLGPPCGDLLQACGEVGLLWLVLWYMYRHRTFLRA
jgi:predicted acyltransferase